MRWIVQWDSPVQMAWNGLACMLLGVAVVSWARMPRPWFARAGLGRWWLLGAVLGISAFGGGYWLPMGSVLWLAWWRPRLRRGPTRSEVVTAERDPSHATHVMGEPLL